MKREMTTMTYDARKALEDYHAHLVERGLLPRQGHGVQDGMMRDPYTDDPTYRHLYDAYATEQLAQASPAAIAEARRRYQTQEARQVVDGVLGKVRTARRAQDLSRLAEVRAELDHMRASATPELARAMKRTDNAIRRLDRLRKQNH